MTVTAERRWGEGVEGVGLILFTGSRQLGFAETDGEGQATFDFVPFGVMGVSASMPAGFRPKDLAEGYVQTFRITFGGSESVAFTLLNESPGDLEVRVEDPEGEAIAGVQLQLFSSSGVVAEFESDSTGVRRFADLPFGDYGVRALPGLGYQVEGFTSEVDGLLVEGDWVERTTLLLDRCIGSIRIEALRESGDPVSGLAVTLYTPEGEVATVVTDGAGHADFPDLFCGDYGVRTPGRSGKTLVAPAAGFLDGLVVEHRDERLARFTFRPCEAVIRVQVEDEAGTPVPGAVLALYDRDGSLGQGASDLSGIFIFEGVPCGDDRAVDVEPPAGFSVPNERGRRYVDGLALGEGDAIQIRFTLDRE